MSRCGIGYGYWRWRSISPRILPGEFVAAVMRGIRSQEYWSLPLASNAILGMAFAFVLRWRVFDVAHSANVRHIRYDRHAALFQIWQYAHLPLFLGIGVAGAGFQRAISLAAGDRLQPTEALVLCSAVTALMFGVITIGATSESAQKRGGLANYLWPVPACGDADRARDASCSPAARGASGTSGVLMQRADFIGPAGDCGPQSGPAGRPARGISTA